MSRVYDFYSMKYIYFQDAVTFDLVSDSTLRALQSVQYNNDIEAVKNIGGDADAAWMIEGGQPDPSLSIVATELRAGLYNAVEDVTVTTVAASATGSIGTLTNKSGTSIKNVTNGINAVAVSSTNGANIQAGTYIFKKGSTATTCDIFGVSLTDTLTDIDNLLVKDVNCGTAGTVEVPAAGIAITVIGTPVFVEGDVAVCEQVRPVHEGVNTIQVGGSSSPTIKRVTLIQPKQTTGDIYVITVPKVFFPGGLPFGAATRAFSEITINGSPIVNDDGSVYTIEQILGSS